MKTTNVYVITNQVNGKRYIGITTKPVEQRLHEHILASRRGVPFALYGAMRKHGEESFQIECLESCAGEELAKRRERKYIAEMNSMESGYNMTAGGDGFACLVRTEEHRRRIGDAHRGKQVSPEMRRRISETLVAQPGRQHTEDSRKKIGEAQTGDQHWTKRRTDVRPGVPGRYIVTMPDGSQREVVGLSAFAREHGLVPGSLAKTVHCSDRSHRGYSARRVTAAHGETT